MSLSDMLDRISKRKKNTAKAREEMFKIIDLLGQKLQGIEIDFVSSPIFARGIIWKNDNVKYDIEGFHRVGYGYFGLWWNGKKLRFALISDCNNIPFSSTLDVLDYVNFKDFLKAIEELVKWAENVNTWEEEVNKLEEIRKILEN